MMSETLATSIGKTERYSVTFEVADEFLIQAQDGEWSQPVRYRFEQLADGRWDLVMKVGPSPNRGSTGPVSDTWEPW